ncbi:hypothetical protein [Flavobacterium saccharophilum]|uniref:DUF3300 domain-containing protein n=1 Tax=Flavobacterium saccharophilum TaxID=29534 RepID=A0A1M7G8Y7_9FLAO|nr:hypothetical protein [Flavobacterium saccharophilum]SHM12397.1 hypothetical protein SAMN05444366_2430 [Flavobacterium saccharophilum]
MKAKVLFLVFLAIGLSSCSAQSQTTVYAKNSDISDNLDLRAVASIFGESANLQDFERRLNDPKYQISNLDLNGDDQVDYLRVIESVEARTHVVIIQAALDRDVYQDIATIDVERDNYNQVNVQVVGNSYLYGANYIYEPVYSVVPVIYTSFWITNYRPYISTWTWGYYPTYYSAWRPYPIYRYRNNINVCINVNNHYNYVNTRRSYRAPALYESRRTYGYEKMRPNNSFAQRHSNVSNRYELDQRRVASRESSRNSNVYNSNRSNTNRVSDNNTRNISRDNTQNRGNSDKNYNSNRVSSRDNENKVSTPTRVENTQRTTEPRRDYSENNNSRGNSEKRMNTNRTAATPRTEAPRNSDYNTNNSRGNSEKRMNTNRAASSPRAEAPRNYTENRASTARPQTTQSPQRSEAPRVSQESRGGGNSQKENNSGGSRGNGRRI